MRGEGLRDHGHRRVEVRGEAGGDTFAYAVPGDSAFRSGRFDQIMDFSRADGDMIDLSAIDANSRKSGNQMFRFDPQGDGWAGRGQISCWIDGGQTHIYGNTDKDKAVEFYLVVDGEITLASTDFVL